MVECGSGQRVFMNCSQESVRTLARRLIEHTVSWLLAIG